MCCKKTLMIHLGHCLGFLLSDSLFSDPHCIGFALSFVWHSPSDLPSCLAIISFLHNNGFLLAWQSSPSCLISIYFLPDNSSWPTIILFLLDNYSLFAQQLFPSCTITDSIASVSVLRSSCSSPSGCSESVLKNLPKPKSFCNRNTAN